MDLFIYLSLFVLFSCNFETDFCQFSNLYGLELQFQRTQAFHLIDDYAPERDHTLNNLAGSFIYVNTLNTLSNSKAQLRSSRYIPLNDCKVRFYYYLNSATNPGLLTFMTRNESSGVTTLIWSTSKILGNHWERQELLLPSGVLSELIIEVRSLGNGGGFIALDDISFSSQCNSSNGFLPFGTSTLSPNGTTTPSTCTYACDDNTCVGQDKVKIFLLIEIERTFFGIFVAL
jgi:hypothetical protein